MALHEDSVRERVAFLSQGEDRLRQSRGRELYDQLESLGLNHFQFFRAAGTNVTDYCAQEFGVDLKKITVDRFFNSDPNAKWLFPDIVREAVVSGMKKKPAYPQLILGDERITGTAYDVPYVEESAADEELRTVAEGAAIPESEISYGDRIIRLDKKGRGVIASYEAVRRMSMDLLRVHLMRMGERLGRNLDARLASILVNGDSSDGDTSPVTLNTEVADTWAYLDVVKGVMKLGQEHYFTPTHMLAGPALAQTILNIEQFKDAALFDFAKTGHPPALLGAQLTPMADQPENKLTVLDAGYAAQKVTEQDLLVESDKLINRQWDRTYLTVVTEFAVIYPKARVVVQSDWS